MLQERSVLARLGPFPFIQQSLLGCCSFDHFVREAAARKQVELAYIPTHENLADMMTKGLPPKLHNHLLQRMLYGLDEEDSLSLADGARLPTDAATVREVSVYKDLPLQEVSALRYRASDFGRHSHSRHFGVFLMRISHVATNKNALK